MPPHPSLLWTRPIKIHQTIESSQRQSNVGQWQMQTGVLKAIATRPVKLGPMVTIESADLVPGVGLAGEPHRVSRRQVTVLSAEKWRTVCEELGTDLPWTMRRANLLVSGVDLQPKPGDLIEIGDVVLEITRETTPCKRMEDQFAGLQQALEPDARGGVCTRIISGGRVMVGDVVRLINV
jgi:MOSC domain-containing protein YiiM